MDIHIYLYTVLKHADISIMADTGTSWFMPFDIKRFQERPRTLLKSWKMTLGIKKCLQICPLTYIYKGDLGIVGVEQTQTPNKPKVRINLNFEQTQKFLALGRLRIIRPPDPPSHTHTHCRFCTRRRRRNLFIIYIYVS